MLGGLLYGSQLRSESRATNFEILHGLTVETKLIHYFFPLLYLDNSKVVDTNKVRNKLAGFFFSHFNGLSSNHIFSLLVAVVNQRCVVFELRCARPVSAHSKHYCSKCRGHGSMPQQATCVHIIILKDLLKLCYFQL